MNSNIIVRLDEWMEKIETTSEGTFLHISADVREEVLEELIRVLGGSDGE